VPTEPGLGTILHTQQPPLLEGTILASGFRLELGFAQDQVWCELVALACELLA